MVRLFLFLGLLSLLHFFQACKFEASAPQAGLPDHSIDKATLHQFHSKQESYAHTDTVYHLGLGKKWRDDEDQQFWQDFLRPYREGRLSLADLLAEISGSGLVESHSVATYRCPLIDGSFKNLIDKKSPWVGVKDPCSKDGSDRAAILAPSADRQQLGYFFASFAEQMEVRLHSFEGESQKIFDSLFAMRFHKAELLQERGHYFVFAQYPEASVVYFRGSASDEDWRSNIVIRLTEAEWLGPEFGLVHAGFHDAVTTVWPHFTNILQKFGKKKVYLVGLSRGGGLALLSGARLLQEAQFQPHVVTFGQPRVGNQIFADQIDRLAERLHYLRFVNVGDMVVNLPPRNESLPEFNFILE